MKISNGLFCYTNSLATNQNGVTNKEKQYLNQSNKQKIGTVEIFDQRESSSRILLDKGTAAHTTIQVDYGIFSRIRNYTLTILKVIGQS